MYSSAVFRIYITTQFPSRLTGVKFCHRRISSREGGGYKTFLCL